MLQQIIYRKYIINTWFCYTQTSLNVLVYYTNVTSQNKNIVLTFNINRYFIKKKIKK